MFLVVLLLISILPLPLPAQTNAESSDVIAKKAAEARDANRLDEAEALYKRALALKPGWAEGWWYLGTLRYDRDDYAGAAAALQRAVRLSPKSGVAYVMLGLSEAKLGRDRDALIHIDKGRALGIGDDSSLRRVVLYTQGTLLLTTGEFGKAQAVLDSLAREGAEQEEAIVALGQSVLGVGTPALASATPATRAIIRRAGWAEHLAAQRQTKEALREYSSLAADAPTFHNVQFAYGRFLLNNHQDEDAVKAFQRELANTPNHLLARLGLAGILATTNPAAGIPYAEEAVKLSPKLAEAHYLLGVLLSRTDETGRAIAELETARRLNPDEAKIYYALSRVYVKVERLEDAARARKEFARLNAQSADGAQSDSDIGKE